MGFTGVITGPYLFNWIRDPPTKPAQTTSDQRRNKKKPPTSALRMAFNTFCDAFTFRVRSSYSNLRGDFSLQGWHLDAWNVWPVGFNV